MIGRGTDPNVPVYCIDRSDGGALNVQVTPDSSQTDPLNVQLAVSTDRPFITSRGCPTATDFVVTADTLTGPDRGINAGFYVAVIA